MSTSLTTTGSRSLADLRGATTDTGRFDPDAFHAMERRDDALVADGILRGSLSGAFTYQFEISGKTVEGVSVIGARHIASKYGALRHRIVASMEKTGARFLFQTYPFEKTPMSAQVSFLPEIADEPDFYKVVVELTDIKTGYTLQVEKTEARYEYRKDGTRYDRPNYQLIAQSKAFRNGVLDIVPQDLVIAFKAECLKLGKSADLTADLMAEKRGNIIAYATRVGIPVDRAAVQQLTHDQITGLSEATRQAAEMVKAATDDTGREGGRSIFTGALQSVGLIQPSTTTTAAEGVTPKQVTTARTGRGQQRTDPAEKKVDPPTAQSAAKDPAPSKPPAEQTDHGQSKSVASQSSPTADASSTEHEAASEAAADRQSTLFTDDNARAANGYPSEEAESAEDDFGPME